MVLSKCSVGFNILRVASNEIAALKDFYENVFGMVYEEVSANGSKRHRFSFEHQPFPTGICFVETSSVFEKYPANAGYWKIGITVQDVDAASTWIEEKTGTKMGSGNQFESIGFVNHLKDPAGYTIELLQHSFGKNFKVSIEKEKSFLGQPKSLPAQFGQITIRCKDGEKSCHFYSEVLGMKLVSVQPSENYPFTLYFYAYTDLSPPNPDDLNAIENREWLWKQSFPQIELQHLKKDADFSFATNDKDGMIGHVGFQVHVTKERFERIKEMGNDSCQDTSTDLIVSDPDGYRIEIVSD